MSEIKLIKIKFERHISVFINLNIKLSKAKTTTSIVLRNIELHMNKNIELIWSYILLNIGTIQLGCLLEYLIFDSVPRNRID